MQEPVELARELARIARENGLAEIEYREEATVLRLIFERKAPRPVVHAASPLAMSTPTAMLQAPLPGAPSSPASAPAAEPASQHPVITSPLAGVFYQAPRPGAPPFVEAGQSLSTGQTLCIVEAMKLMNEITAEGPIRVLRILAENGSVVESGQPLFEYEPLG